MKHFQEIRTCNVCNAGDVVSILHIPGFPVVLQPLSSDSIEKLKRLQAPSTMDLLVGMCRSCGHMFLLSRPNEELLRHLYEECYGTFVSPLKSGISVSDADTFLDVFGRHVAPELPAGVRILDVGCFDGYVISRLIREGFEACGCDPSPGARMGQEMGLPIVRDFFSPDLFAANHFDVVINRNLLEHIDRPVPFLASLRESIGDKGIIVTETPNGEYCLRNGVRAPFHFEHLSVFTPASLAACARGAGLITKAMFADTSTLISIFTTDRADADIGANAAFHIDRLLDLAPDFGGKIARYLSDIDGFVEEKTAAGSSFAAWGAGGGGSVTLSLTRSLPRRLSVLVDRDPNKHGKRFFHMDIGISPPETLISNPVDYIVVCSQFSREVFRDVRETYGLNAEVLSIIPRIEIMQ